MPSCRDCFISEKTFAKVPPFLAFLGSPEATLVANTPCAPLAGGNAVVDGCGKAAGSAEPAAEEYTLMTIDTIINGKVGPALACAPTACPDPPPPPRAPLPDRALLLAGRCVPRADPHPELLPGEHGGGCGHQMQHSELLEADQEESIWYGTLCFSFF